MVGIYLITNLQNGKKYVGQSQDIEARWYKHKNALKNGTHVNSPLQYAWNKYGPEAFNFSILEECALEELDQKERYYIQLYDTYNSGYNLDKGGLGIRGYKHTDEELARMRRIQSPFVVLQFDLKFNLIARFEGGYINAAKHYGYTRDCILRCCQNKKGAQIYKNCYWVYEQIYLNPQFSWEKFLDRQCDFPMVKEKYIPIKKPKRATPHEQPLLRKPIVQANRQGEIVNEFSSQTEASLFISGHRKDSHISAAAKGHIVHKGYLWANKGEDWFVDEQVRESAFKQFEKNKPIRVQQLSLDGESIAIYSSLTEAALSIWNSTRKLGSLSQAINKGLTAGGFRWKIVKDES